MQQEEADEVNRLLIAFLDSLWRRRGARPAVARRRSQTPRQGPRHHLRQSLVISFGQLSSRGLDGSAVIFKSAQ